MSNKDRKREEGKRDLLALPELDDQELQRLERQIDSQVHVDGIWDDWRHLQRTGLQYALRFGKRLNIMRNAVLRRVAQKGENRAAIRGGPSITFYGRCRQPGARKSRVRAGFAR